MFWTTRPPVRYALGKESKKALHSNFDPNEIRTVFYKLCKLPQRAGWVRLDNLAEWYVWHIVIWKVSVYLYNLAAKPMYIIIVIHVYRVPQIVNCYLLSYSILFYYNFSINWREVKLLSKAYRICVYTFTPYQGFCRKWSIRISLPQKTDKLVNNQHVYFMSHRFKKRGCSTCYPLYKPSNAVQQHASALRL